MALITPTPTRGSWLELDPPTPITWRPQPTRGSWLELDPHPVWTKSGWHVGRVVW